MNYPMLSRERFKYLLGLSRKKERLETGELVVEGANILEQLLQNGLRPREFYIETPQPLLELYPDVPVIKLQKGDLQRICDTGHAQGIAALYPVPRPRDANYKRAFYLDGISDPGNMGTIFRIAAAFGIECLLLSEGCVEISSPKVVRASLGSVYWVPYRIVPTPVLLNAGSKLICLDMQGTTELKDYQPTDESTVYVIGSEAHGIHPEILTACSGKLRIAMHPEMESLNAAIVAGILGHHLYTESGHQG